MCQELIYMTLLNVFSELNPLNIVLVLQLLLLLLSYKKLYHLCGSIIAINKIKAHFSFMLSLNLYNMHSSHFAYEGVCRLIKAWPVLKERQMHLFMHLCLLLKTADRGRRSISSPAAMSSFEDNCFYSILLLPSKPMK